MTTLAEVKFVPGDFVKTNNHPQRVWQTYGWFMHPDGTLDFDINERPRFIYSSDIHGPVMVIACGLMTRITHMPVFFGIISGTGQVMIDYVTGWRKAT